VIAYAVTCPHPPLLLPGVTGGVVPEVEALRAACGEAVAGMRSVHPDVIVVVGGAPLTRIHPAAALPLDRFAPRGRGPRPVEPMPVSLAVGLALTADVDVPIELHGVESGAPVEECRDYGRRLADRRQRIGLLVMADGSARRGPKAPGYVDERAVSVDDLVDEGLRNGDTEPLLKLDASLADDLLVAGRAGWQVLAGACEPARVRARCHYSAAPFGVWYPVFSWVPDPAGAAQPR
jgi:hypothetical protein